MAGGAERLLPRVRGSYLSPLCCPEGISSLAVLCKVAAEIPSGELWMWVTDRPRGATAPR